MNKNDLIRDVANKTGTTIKESTVFVDAFFDALTDALKNGEKIQISGFGTFEIKEKPARDAINPKTQEPISLEASKTPIFKFGKAYKDLFK